MQGDHRLVRAGCLLTPIHERARGRDAVADARLGLRVPCTVLVLGATRLHGLKYFQVLITHAEGEAEVQLWRTRDLLDCFEVCPDA